MSTYANQTGGHEMRPGGVPNSVLWGDTASLSPPDSRPLSQLSASDQTATMNCFEGLPPANHHHHAIHHTHHPHVIHLLSHSAPATPPTTPNNNTAASPPPDDGVFVSKQETDKEEPMDVKEATEDATPAAVSPLSTGSQGARVKEEQEEGNLQDDSGISPGSRGSGSSVERVQEVESVHSSGHEEDEAPSPQHNSANVEDHEDCPSPGSSERGPSREGRVEDGNRCASSPYSEDCYSGGEDADALRRLQYSVERGGPYQSGEEGASQGGDGYEGNGQRADGMGSDEDDGSDMNVTKPRITSQGKLKTFRCKQCDFVALTKLEFWEHSRMHIRAERLLTCPRCPFVTEYKHHLEYHLRNHFGSKPFKCPHCPYTCVNKSMLNSHLKSHSSVYQYRCADCGYATKYCHSLKLHLRKYSHQPAMVLHPDGSPNPLPVIDVYGTRRGPKTGSKKGSQEPAAVVPQTTIPTTTSAPPVVVTSTTVTAPAAPTVPVVPTASVGHPYQAMVVYHSPPSPSQPTPTTAVTTYAPPNGTSYYSGPVSMQATAPVVGYPSYTTPQPTRPMIPRALYPPRDMEVVPGDATQGQWAKDDADQTNGKKVLAIPTANNRPVKCTLCEFATTSREAFAEHMMVHAANGDVGNKDMSVPLLGSEAAAKAPQQVPVVVNGGNGYPLKNDAGLNEYLARMLTAVVPHMGAYRGPVPPHLQAQWHAHVQQQMHQQMQRMQVNQLSAQPNQQSAPISPQRPWLKPADEVPTVPEEPSAPAPKQDAEVLQAAEERSPERPGGGLPLDLTKESAPKQDERWDEKRGAGGSSRRKGKAFKLERLPYMRDEDGGNPSEEDERNSRHSEDEEDVVEPKRRAIAVEPKTKVSKPKENDKEDYHCPYCDIAFRDVVLYTMHMGYHGYQDPFKCNMCGQETNDKVSFFLHIARSSHS
ncbi:hypothetical protein J437_LFUL008202 [Ladona fulva]|uniref:Protein hunchback n=1 Tax=Ladona fulva TaxID=123851 RepID=A0A8K0K6R9_LADFU|nr:hypothetical protein J437_LFUL008202 [Ladona fulva]